MPIQKILLILIFVFFSINILLAQKIGIGASGIYNFQTESFAGGLRLHFQINKLSIVPQFSYYPAFNKIHEYYGGLALEYRFFPIKKWWFYGLAHGAYNGWINHEATPMAEAKYTNWDLDLGAGLRKNTCFTPFIEYRYNLKWHETHLHLGFLYFFNCKASRGSGKLKKSNKKYSCPAY